MKSIHMSEVEPDAFDMLGSQLDDMYNALVIEHGVMTTDYSHTFKANKVAERMKSSPY